MHRHVRRIGDQAAGAVEDRAGEVEPLLDVDRIGGVLQHDAHLLGDRHEQVVEDLEHHRIGFGADGGALRQGHNAVEHDRVLRAHRCPPAGLDHDRLVRLDDQRRPGDGMAGPQAVAQEDARRPPGAFGVDAHACMRMRFVIGERVLRLGDVGAAADRLHLEALDHDRLVLEDEAELLAMRRLEFPDHDREGEEGARDRHPSSLAALAPQDEGFLQPHPEVGGEAAADPAGRRAPLHHRHRDRRIGAVVAQMGAGNDGDLGIAYALCFKLRRSLVFKF